MPNPEYRAIFVPPDLHKKIKLLAVKKNLPMYAVVEELMKKHKI